MDWLEYELLKQAADAYEVLAFIALARGETKLAGKIQDNAETISAGARRTRARIASGA